MTINIYIILAAWLATMGGMSAVIAYLESVASDELEESIARWLKNASLPSDPNWPTTFTRVFDSVFGERHLSLRCFALSCFFSIISVTSLILIICAFFGESPYVLMSDTSSLKSICMIIVCVNISADYVSLLETRYLLGWVSNNNNIRLGAVLIIDVIISVMLFACAVWMTVAVFTFLGHRPSYTSFNEIIISVVKALVLYDQEHIGIAIFLYSTLLTSVWLWLYGLSGLAVRLANRINQSLPGLRRNLDLKEPIRVLGLAAMSIVTIGFITLPVVRYLTANVPS